MRHGALYQDIVPFTSRYYDKGKFGRIFPSLPAFAQDTPKVREALIDIGKKGGIMDAKDDLTQSPLDLIANPALQTDNPNSPVMGAGMTFLGQFLDHDITFDPTSSLERQSDPEFVENFRTPSLGLDNVYGSGPGASPHLYDQSDGWGIKMLLFPLGIQGKENIDKYDLPRNSQNVALIGDPRDDENLIISQLQVLFLRFHNVLVDAVKKKYPTKSPSEVFSQAQELVRWHYQWILVHEFLPLLCGQDVIDDIMNNGRKFYGWHNQPFIPVEFSVAAYRFGHSQVRPSYRANFGIFNQPNPLPFFADIFDFTADPNAPDPNDLRGGKRANRRFIDWHTFFNLGDASMRPNKLIDTKLSSPLFQLPGSVATGVISLASRNLLRGLTFSLPSGQRVAQAMRFEPLGADVFNDLKHYKLNLETSTPLWFYILKEAEVQQMGVKLGDVGARIVAEVFIGLLEGDNTSYISQNPFWKPTLPCWEPYRNNKHFTIADLTRIAEGKVPVVL
ncbi:heme peroxidase family protein [Mucilaginibacter sp. SMC90]|uniref:peroxidase family protein n=1 Tax=Mucilaginibacter sp. SMC90 TaxID=2929803 RepID=UPI001FB429E6|nr:heme peroxidase family protein [Mucilaginibacter sp. SMC90]UOE52296.1 heme peroxidase family protein [Mucilaginibacter sp. SMC90]